MSMVQYDNRRENLWKDAYKDDPAFLHGESPTAKVINFFCKRKSNEPEVDINKCTPEKEVDFNLLVNTEWCRFHLDRTLRYKRSWNDYNITLLGNLLVYITQCESGGYSKCIISKQEYMSVKPK